MKSKIFTLSLLLTIGTFLGAQSNLFIDTSPTPEQMVLDFFSNTEVTPTNIVFNGSPVSIGYFEAAGTDMGVTAGIVLSTGDVSLLGKVAEEFASSATGGDPDADLALLGGGLGGSFDAAVLEFDFVASVADLDFTYVFGSEEYPDFTSSTFTDVFGFLVSGPGLPSPYENIALVPGTTAPVSIGNVNDQNNPQFYVDYLGQDGAHVAFNGLTTLLSAPFQLTPGATYHVKIGVTDIGNFVYDSGVFIDIESLMGTNLLTPPAIFQLSQVDNTIALTNESRYATSWTWDFGDNTTSTERHPGSHTYAEPGTYTVTLTTQNYCCTDTYSYTVEVGTVGTSEAVKRFFSVTPNPATDHLQLQMEQAGPLTYQLRDALGQVQRTGTAAGSTTLPVENLSSGLYFLTVQQAGHVYTEKVVLR